MTGTHREIGRRRMAAGEARTVLIRRRYHAPIQDVWEACTDPERLNRWFLPVSGDLRAGGRFRLEGNAGGEVLRCEPPRLLTVTWVYGDLPADEVELRLSAAPTATPCWSSSTPWPPGPSRWAGGGSTACSTTPRAVSGASRPAGRCR
jgi:hypothetical protein